MATHPPSPGNVTDRNNEDAEASIVCGGVALAAARRTVRSFRMSIWLIFWGQAAVGISTMVMSVLLLSFMVDRVSEGKDDFSPAVGQWATAFALNTLHLILQPILLALFLLVPCRSRLRLYRTVWGLCSLSIQLDINAFIQVMIWRVNEHATCEYLDQGADDMPCSETQGIGTAIAIMIILLQGILDWYYISLLHRARPMSADPVLRETLRDQSEKLRRRVGIVRWLLKEGEGASCCGRSKPDIAAAKKAYQHKRTDNIELDERRIEPAPVHSSDGKGASLFSYQSRNFGTLSTDMFKS